MANRVHIKIRGKRLTLCRNSYLDAPFEAIAYVANPKYRSFLGEDELEIAHNEELCPTCQKAWDNLLEASLVEKESAQKELETLVTRERRGCLGFIGWIFGV